MFLYRAETKDCRVFPNNTITKFNNRKAGVQYRLYALRHTRRVLYFFTKMYYNESTVTCQEYGGIVYTPRTKDDIMVLHNHSIHGFVGLMKSSSGSWVDSAGQLYEKPALWHAELYPTGNGDCAKVRDGYLVDCSCSGRLRKFACDVLYDNSAVEGSLLN
ncbi:uncharacterized protein LOC123509628 [Portunus trituberculatus]|uniref:uncharacterized protein LOC123509628 n=1 Tax=Portunus trituberculatus TaxID=210409 RepID=UPI001E1CD334|nr:uncharacterized protein LOC123509628 [Portunus trituberculatus]